MIRFLTKVFIHDSENTSSPEVRRSYGTLCGIVGIVLNALLFAGKMLAGTISHSIAITADAFNNLSDAGSSLITLTGFRMAGQKPDPGHPFGHGRIEYLSGLIVAMLIVLMAFELIRDSIGKIIHPEETQFSLLIVVILVVSILVKIYMSFYNRSIGNKINSAAMKATAEDSLSDTIATTAVLICTLVSHFTGLKIDGICGLVVGIFVLFAGFRAAKETIDPLLGQAPDPEFVKQIRDIALVNKNILGIHDLVVHNYGPGRVMISFHAEVPADGNILELHDIIDNTERELREKLNCDAVIHMDPIMNKDSQTLELKSKVAEMLKTIDPEIHFHDFRIVKGPTHTNVIFDILVPYGFHINDDDLLARIDEDVKHLSDDTEYYAVINIDKDYAGMDGAV